MEGRAVRHGLVPLGEKRRASIAKVKELWRLRGKGVVDKKAWTIFLSSGRSFEELFLADPSDSSSSDSEGQDQCYWDPTWMEDKNEERNRRTWEREEVQREQDWRRKHEVRKLAETEAFRLWSQRWDERNLALQRRRTPRGRPPKSRHASSCTPRIVIENESDEAILKNESDGREKERRDSRESGKRAQEPKGLYFMGVEGEVEESEEDRKRQREWAREVAAAELRMEKGQSAVASSFKRRREQFYENRRSINSLSSGEVDLIGEGEEEEEASQENSKAGGQRGGKSLEPDRENEHKKEKEKGIDKEEVDEERELQPTDEERQGEGKKGKGEGSFRLLSSLGRAQTPDTAANPGGRTAGDKQRFLLRRVLSSDNLKEGSA